MSNYAPCEGFHRYGTLDLKAVIWDWDGTSADTLPHCFEFWKKICNESGRPFPLIDYDHVRREMRDPFWRFYEEVLGIDFKRENVWIKPAFESFMKRCDIKLRLGVKEPWEYCSSLGLKTGIASSNLEEIICPRLDRLGVSYGGNGLVRSIVGYGPAIPPKPDPKSLLECAAQLGVNPGACLYVGDTPVDVAASKSIGMLSAVVSGGYATREALIKANPDYFVDSVEELQVFIRWLLAFS